MEEYYITEDILDGNMGDGWKNNYETACSFATFIEETYRNTIEQNWPGISVTFGIEVKKDTSGYTSGLSVVGDNWEKANEIEEYLQRLDTWSEFLDSDIVKPL